MRCYGVCVWMSLFLPLYWRDLSALHEQDVALVSVGDIEFRGWRTTILEYICTTLTRSFSKASLSFLLETEFLISLSRHEFS